MIVETPLDFEWIRFEKLAGLPRQQEWRTYMSIFHKRIRTLLLLKNGN
jgi:hypothetical protein